MPEDLSKTPKLKDIRLQILSEFQFSYGNSPKCLPKPTKLLTSLCLALHSLLISAIYCSLLLLLWVMIMLILLLKPSFPCSRIFIQEIFVYPGNFLSLPPPPFAPHLELFCPMGNSADYVNFSSVCLSITLPFFVTHIISVMFHKGRGCISLLPHSSTILNIELTFNKYLQKKRREERKEWKREELRKTRRKKKEA